nr:M20/M25/M40 family metallo-hydrolase [Deltaproteobacteria bacterium]
AYAEIDVRAPDNAAAELLHQQFESITAKTTIPDTTGEVTGGIMFPPMVQTPQSKRLFESLQEAGRILGLDLEGIATGGGSDGNHSAQFAPTLDGMGSQGSMAHSDREFMEVASLTERSKVTALFLVSWPEVIAELEG